jgi:hypothetical protein
MSLKQPGSPFLIHTAAASFAAGRIPQRAGRGALGHAQRVAHSGLAAVVQAGKPAYLFQKLEQHRTNMPHRNGSRMLKIETMKFRPRVGFTVIPQWQQRKAGAGCSKKCQEPMPERHR